MFTSTWWLIQRCNYVTRVRVEQSSCDHRRLYPFHYAANEVLILLHNKIMLNITLKHKSNNRIKNYWFWLCAIFKVDIVQDFHVKLWCTCYHYSRSDSCTQPFSLKAVNDSPRSLDVAVLYIYSLVTGHLQMLAIRCSAHCLFIAINTSCAEKSVSAYKFAIW